MRMKLAILLTLFLIPSLAHAQPAEPTAYVTGAWARPAQVDSGGLSAAYMTLENPGDSALRLVAAAAPAAEEVQLHQSQVVDNVMHMRPVEGIDLPPGETVTLEPGGYHLMLMGLPQDLMVGDALSLDLTFEQTDGGDPLTLTIGVPVLDEAPPPSGIVVLDAWARPTALAAGEESMSSMPGMDMGGEETPEAAMDMNMDMGNAMVTSDVTAVYMRLLNRSASADALVGAKSDVAGTVEIHESKVVDNVMQMRPVVSIPIPLNDLAVLEPGGYHLMLTQVLRGLVVGDAFNVTLVFESGLELPVAVPVRDNLSG